METTDYKPQNDGCLGKRRFEAMKRAEVMAARDGERYGDKMVPYKCPRCEGFHLARDKSGNG